VLIELAIVRADIGTGKIGLNAVSASLAGELCTGREIIGQRVELLLPIFGRRLSADDGDNQQLSLCSVLFAFRRYRPATLRPRLTACRRTRPMFLPLMVPLARWLPAKAGRRRRRAPDSAESSTADWMNERSCTPECQSHVTRSTSTRARSAAVLLRFPAVN
jgi:hypothetical protein